MSNLDIATELANYIKEASKTADNLRAQAALALKRADEVDAKVHQATLDAIAIRDARAKAKEQAEVLEGQGVLL